MDLILEEIEKALRAELYYSAITMTLKIPDICAALESPDGRTSKQKYITWYNTNLGTRLPNITGEDCYSLRCGVLHQGCCGHPDMQYSRILFTIPNAQQNIFHNNIINDALNLDSKLFCGDIMECARLWFNINKTNPTVENNLPKLVQLHPQGLAPYMVGIPLIA